MDILLKGIVKGELLLVFGLVDTETIEMARVISPVSLIFLFFAIKFPDNRNP